MEDRLELQYENELGFIRDLASEFAKQRPKIADRLQIDRETGYAEDPHVERLIEGFAFLTARIRLKLDDEIPEVTSALLDILYPHYLAPIPSMGIVQFHLDPSQAKLTSGYTIERGTPMYSREVGGIPCRFRTTAPITLWPLSLEDANYETAPFGRGIIPPPRSRRSDVLIRISLRNIGQEPLDKLDLDRLRIFLSGDDMTVYTLYELLFTSVTDVVLRPLNATGDAPSVVLPPETLQPVGFELDEGMLPYSHRSFLGYRLLTEYFAFPRKFLFFDVCDLGRVRELEARDGFEIYLFLDRAAPQVAARLERDTFRLGCAPIVNLFKQRAEPIRLTHSKTEYHVIPDVRRPRSLEVYSVDAVESINPDTKEVIPYRPFYSFQHAYERHEQKAYWHIHRRPSIHRDDAGTEVYLSLVDLNFDPYLPPTEVLLVDTTCSNRDLPAELRTAGGADWQFHLQGQAPLESIIPLVGPTRPVRLPFEQNHWRLISHLALNHLSITGGPDAATALREVLKLYDYASTRVTSQQIDGIVSVASRRTVAPVQDGTMAGFCRGLEVTVDFDEEKYTGMGFYLLAAVLERFFGLYTSINSFTRTIARGSHQGRILKRWPPRAGERTIA